ncbi:MAG TPA: hypothetical protein VKI19_07265, partial [Acidimicrobiales bacterium]|nr:hypothetical protein [Acidimicrobiales bacterium]
TSPTFGNLYPGIGLEVELSAAARLHTLSVISPTLGWAGSAYVSDAPIQSGQPLSAWGPATSTTSGIAGNATFQLGGRTGRYVLLWITNLGPADMARIAELSVR